MSDRHLPPMETAPSTEGDALSPIQAPTVQGLRLLCTDHDDDRLLVTRLRDGDWTALDTLYDRYARTVFLRCWRILRQRQSAWEITQETFATFLVHLPCRCGQPARQWLFDTSARLATQVATDGKGRR